MFTTHLPRVNSTPHASICLGAGLLLIVALLVAIAAVASGEVKKAQMRDSLQASQRTAIGYCLEVLRGEALNSCIRQAKADRYGADTTALADSGAAVSPNVVVVPIGAQSLMPVAFSAQR